MVNSQFLSEAPEALTQFPGLTISETEENCLQGIIEIKSEGLVVDQYKIKLIATDDYPFRYPKVYELGGRIPVNNDWHVYDDGHWCFGAPVEEAMKCRNGISLTTFLSTQVTGYLFSQIYRRENGYFYKERSHGVSGICEFYQDYFNTKNLKTVFEAMHIVSSGKEPKSNAKCFCGSNKKFEKCHRAGIRIIGKLAQKQVTKDFETLKANLIKK